MLWNSRDEFLGSVESHLNTNPKRFLLILKLNCRSHTIPDGVSTPISASTSTGPGYRTPLRSAAENPREITNLFNSYFASIFAHDTPSPFIWKRCQCTSFFWYVGINAHGQRSPIRTRSPSVSRKPPEFTENYTHISLPSLVSKVLERCVFNTSKIDLRVGKRLSTWIL